MKKPNRTILQFEYIDDFEVTKEDVKRYIKSIGLSVENISLISLEDDERVNGKIAYVTIVKD